MLPGSNKVRSFELVNVDLDRELNTCTTRQRLAVDMTTKLKRALAVIQG